MSGCARVSEVSARRRRVGVKVRIRLTVQDYTYVFGDDTCFGPTTSPRGINPDGDVTHTYPCADTYDTPIDIAYGSEFSVDGQAWITTLTPSP